MPGMARFDPEGPLAQGVTLIEASAGTGKTYTIASLFLRLVVEQGLGVNEILVVTFTDAATAELRERIRERLRAAIAAYQGQGPRDDGFLVGLVQRRLGAGHGEQDLRQLQAALAGFDEAAISTIHGFCARMLRENAFESGVPFQTELLTDEGPLRDEVTEDYWTEQLHDASADLVRYLAANKKNQPQLKVTPDNLKRLSKRVCSHRRMPVLPPTAPHVPAISEQAWTDALAAVAHAWRDRLGIEAAFEQAQAQEVFHKNYKVELTATRLKALDRWLAGVPQPSRQLPVGFACLCRSGIDKKIKKANKPQTPQHPLFDACEAVAALASAHENWLAARALQINLGLVDYARTQLSARKQAQSCQSFDDLLYQLGDALCGPSGAQLTQAIQARFRAALIDEFQDTDPVQYGIFRGVFGKRDDWLFLIGDPKQAIYAFRGADVFAYLQAKQDAGPRAFTLAKNWRSDRSFLQAQRHLFERPGSPFVDPRIAYTPVEAHFPDRLSCAQQPWAAFRIRSVCLEDAGAQRTRNKLRILKPWMQRTIPGLVAEDIIALLNSRAHIEGRLLEPGDIAVLVRKNKQANDVQLELRARGIPSVLHGAGSVFDAQEASELRRILAAVAEPGRGGAVRSALATDALGYTAAQLVELEDQAQAWDDEVQCFRELRKTWLDQGFIQMFRSLLEIRAIQSRILTVVGGARSLTNLLHLSELLHRAASEEDLGIAGLLRWFDRQRQADSELSDANQLRLESDARAVQLITIHKSKGLEYPVVFCPYLWDGALLHVADKTFPSFHDPDDDFRLKLDVGSDARDTHRDLAERELQAENMRLLYVALTRARHHCSVYTGPVNGIHSSPLGYLLHPAQGTGDAALAASARRLKEMSGEAMQAELEQLAASSAGTIELVPIDITQRGSWTPPAREAAELQALESSVWLGRAWRSTSFTGLTRQAPHTSPDSEGADRDALTAIQIEASRGPAGALPIPLSTFPRGAQAGNFFHKVLELADFTTPDEPAFQLLVSATLRLHGFDAERWGEPVRDALAGVLRGPLHEGLRLCDIPCQERLNELEFVFPVAGGLEAGPLRVQPSALAEVFRGYPSASVPTGYPQRVAELGFAPLQGFLGGFIDLIFRHQQRWYLLDYKSNHLGDTFDAYREDRLQVPMAEHHYILQYHIYLLALHRFLGLRQPGYDYDQHIGGVCYLFLRGCSPGAGLGHGVFRDRPARALIDALDRLFADPAGGVA